MLKYYFGTMGFSYKDWKGVFYPIGLAAKEFLSYYSHIFNSVEMDTTFYRIPRISVVKEWGAAVPSDFRFTAKTPQLITHQLGLAGARQYMDEFTDIMRFLGEKLGIILIQLPPSFTNIYLDLFTQFIKQMPDDLRFAVEFRHLSWFNSRTVDILQSHHIGWASAEYINLPRQLFNTTDDIYLRLLGKHAAFRHYDREQVDVSSNLRLWEGIVRKNISEINSVWCYVNNDYSGFAPATCNKIKGDYGLPVIKFQQPVQAKFL